MTSPATVILLIDDLQDWRGTETHLFRLLARLDPSRLRPLLVVLGRAGLCPAFEAAGLRARSLPVPRVFAPEGLLGLVRIVRLLIREQARLLVSYHTAADLLAPPAGLLARVPVLSCRRDMGFTKKPLHRRLQRPLNHGLVGMISVSHAVAREVERTEGFPLERNHVIWNGEDLQRFRPGTAEERSQVRAELGLSDDDLVITCIGGLVEVKDPLCLLEAMERLAPVWPNLRLVFVGEGPLRETIEARAAALDGRVLLTGHRADVERLLRASDLYAQTSRSEGFSNALLQAMGCGLPIVATRVGGNPELVDERCGLLVPEGAPSAVAQALSVLCADPERRAALGLAARDRALAQGSLEAMTAAYEAAFLEAMRPVSRRA